MVKYDGWVTWSIEQAGGTLSGSMTYEGGEVNFEDPRDPCRITSRADWVEAFMGVTAGSTFNVVVSDQAEGWTATSTVTVASADSLHVAAQRCLHREVLLQVREQGERGAIPTP